MKPQPFSIYCEKFALVLDLCEVEVWRGGLGGIYLLADPFVCRCLTNSTMLPFPHPAYRTGRADFPHPALGEDSRNSQGHYM
jgi:transposase